MRIHLVNPSDVSFGTAVITPRWLYVLAAATPEWYGDPVVTDETLEPFDPDGIASATSSVSAFTRPTLFAGIRWDGWRTHEGVRCLWWHPPPFPDEVREHGAAHAVVSGDGDIVWASVLKDCEAGTPTHYRGRPHRASVLVSAVDPLPADRYMWDRCRPFAAARSTARSVRCGERMVKAASARCRGSHS